MTAQPLGGSDAVPHDAIVVGGGAAGLAAATWLARYRREVLLVDSGDYRAAKVEHSHGYLARDPQTPAEFLTTARGQLLSYRSVTYLPGLARAARRTDSGSFVVTLDDGRELAALRLVLATGVRDEMPDIEGFDEHYGASAFHCPACDGYDAVGLDVVAYGWDSRLVGFATTLLDWARSVTVLTSGRRFAGDDRCREVLASHDVELVGTKAVRMLGTRGHLEGVELADGRVLPAQQFFFSIAHHPRLELAEQLGCVISDEGYIAIDESGKTSVDGVWAAGDCVPGLQLTQVAAAQGCAAGVSAALSLHGEPGSPLSPRPAPDADAELAPER